MKRMLRIRRVVVALTVSSSIAVSLVSGVSVRAGQQPTSAVTSGLTGDGRTVTRLPDGRVLIIGGTGSDADVSVVDPVMKTTINLAARLHQPRAWHSATILPTGAILIAGGVSVDGQPIATAERFDLSTETFSPVGMPGANARAGHTATLLTDGRILVAGGVGEAGALVARTEIWNVEAGTVADAPGLRARVGHTAMLQADGDVLISGDAAATGD